MIAAVDPLLLVAVAPLLLFPTLRPGWTVAALTLLVLVWLLRALLRREVWPVGPANAALLLFCLTIPIAVLASSAPELTLPKLTGLILGLAAFRVIGLSVRTPRLRLIALAVFGLLGLGIWAVGILGAGFPFLQRFADRLPPTAMSVIGGADAAVNPNILAGSLVCYLPVAAVLAAYCFQIRRWPLAIVFSVASLALAATIFAARSRSAVLAVAASLALLVLLFAWFRVGRRARVMLLTGSLLLLAVGVVGGVTVLAAGQVGPGQEQVVVETRDVFNKGLSLASRVEIWSRALYALQDFPFTGVGLGSFPRVVPLLYPLFLVAPDEVVGHAHNIFLQTGVDFGLGGLIGYVALLLSSMVIAWQAAGGARGLTHHLALGFLAALFGLQVYGLTDALDAKPAIVLWVLLGLISSLNLELPGCAPGPSSYIDSEVRTAATPPRSLASVAGARPRRCWYEVGTVERV